MKMDQEKHENGLKHQERYNLDTCGHMGEIGMVNYQEYEKNLSTPYWNYAVAS